RDSLHRDPAQMEIPKMNRALLPARGKVTRSTRSRRDQSWRDEDRSDGDAPSRQAQGLHDHCDDWSLVQRALAGHPNAVAQLSKRLQSVHRLTAMRAARHRFLGATSLEDLGQDALLQAWSSLERYEGKCALEGWLWGIVVHVTNAHQRRQIQDEDRQATLQADLRPEDGVTEPDEGESTVEDVSIDLVMRSLPQLTREVLLARAVEGHSYEEIARRNRMTPRAARGRYQRGMERVRERLDRDRA
ncbi:MAG: RNA polymerase sigma factor, partial [Planctomycetota bacterium]